MKVMVVEDSLAIRERIVTILADIVGKHSVSEVDCVNQAIRQIPEYKPNILLLDLLLPDGNGLDVLMMIKARHQSIRVLVMTNDPNEQYKKRALKLGASHFFDKVKDFDKIFAVIADMAVQSP